MSEPEGLIAENEMLREKLSKERLANLALMDELAALKQENKHLIRRDSEWADKYRDALKQGQGEPVATLHDDGYWTFTRTAPAELKHSANYAGWRLPVYTSAPTIPEGVDEFLKKREQDSFSCKLLVADLRALLSAAPKPGEPA